MYSNEDTYALFRTKADEAYLIGENKSPWGLIWISPASSIWPSGRAWTLSTRAMGSSPRTPNSPAPARRRRSLLSVRLRHPGPDGRQAGGQGDGPGLRRAHHTRLQRALKDADEALERAVSYGFPVILKAAAGGGGRGCAAATRRRRSARLRAGEGEAHKAFGNDDIFIEKYLVEPKHIEVQVLGDQYGNVVHLGERDCSLSGATRRWWSSPRLERAAGHAGKARADAVKIARHVGYVNAGTVEFLVDRDGNHYFIEMNPRIQVEHTVTELVTGIDLVRPRSSSPRAPLSHPSIGMGTRSNLHINGYAIQCRVTTEDPANHFAPDTGKITAYRSGGGCGVRLDGGNAYTGP